MSPPLTVCSDPPRDGPDLNESPARRQGDAPSVEGSRPRSSEANGERFQSSQCEALAILRPVRGQRELRQPLHERVDGDLALHARQRGAEAEVHAPPEGDAARARRPARLLWATSESGGSRMASSPRAISSPHALKRSWSSTGTPSISQMTVTGSGYANSSIRSIDPLPSTRASRPSTICWMC